MQIFREEKKGDGKGEKNFKYCNDSFEQGSNTKTVFYKTSCDIKTWLQTDMFQFLGTTGADMNPDIRSIVKIDVIY